MTSEEYMQKFQLVMCHYLDLKVVVCRVGDHQIKPRLDQHSRL